MGKPEESRAVVHRYKVCKLKLHLDDRVLHNDVLIASHIMKVDVHKGDLELLILLVIVDYNLVEIVVHEVSIRVVFCYFFFGQDYFGLVLGLVHLVVIDDVSDLTDVRLC